MTLKNITIIGTSHISIESIQEVETEILTKKPDIVALELDKKRFVSLIGPKRKIKLSDIRVLGVKGFLFNLIGSYIEKKLGQLVGVSPGSEMKKAIQLAHEHKIKVALVDQEISVTLKRLSKAITWKEKFTFVKEIIKGFFVKDKLVKKIDLRKVPSEKIINEMMKRVKKSYPSIHKVLIEERNHIITNKLKNLQELHPDKKILVIIGAGHKNEVIKLLSRD
ncbi:hypothetical protein CL617_00915 [archaeon]|nr:hypothetical protein [archaeon]|tara:strand:- start:31 stop:696 length:666 start_codon:yes stop_codon:yes gene_type:complete